MTKRDLKVGSVSAYYRKLANELPMDLENRDSLYESHMSYANKIDKEEQAALVKFKRASYARKKFK